MKLKSLLFAGFALAALPFSAARAEPVVLRAITPWQVEYDMSQALLMFRDMVNERLAGKVEVRYLGGPEIADPGNQFDAMKNGVVDMVLTAAAYYRSEVPAAAAVMFTSKSPTDLRKSGYADIMRELHAQAGVEYLANTAGGKKYRLYFKTPIENPDFSGKSIRVSPVYLPLVRALGGTPVNVAPNELYTALERGVVQGYGWPETGIRELGLQEQTKYVLDTPFYSLDTALLMNKSVYDGLPDDVKEELQKISVEFESKVEEKIGALLQDENEHLRKEGLNFIRFSPEDEALFLKTAYEAGWNDFLAQNKTLIDANPGLVERLEVAGN
ncbi:TRAP-type C4-dicarboxylate transport system substrate-binding protein [Pseudaminobacter salicylatoxidans]|uniref:TRAP-type C4-dicarboxylate transport system substrate-binding protein n=1 Tax=Pseudaminobacter salicylatoxidans TaxID=93369 RepID=A0A316C1D1_PSESE|nr:TRAP transporter substrate-binding protein DctP [Pseudaminobacter salicylatoxidans]PWJ82370.1 TRAP-type C4-dicarboxylate transport system substrate-binding protein [Pseudaminobacter salicylatoxidans]